MVRLTVLGGSSVASPELVRVLAGTLRATPMEIMLHGRNVDKLEVVGRVCKRIAPPPLTVLWTTDLARALDGADLVLVQVRVGGYRARAFDETFPHEFGLPGEETMGPGGFANSLRTVPAVVALARAVESHAPQAWVLNLTNPSSVVQLALQRATRLRVLGLCDSPASMHEGVAALLGASPSDVQIDYVGMHHFGWITRVWHGGREVTGDVLDRAGDLSWIAFSPVLVRAIGAIPHPYLSYVLSPGVMFQRQQGRRPRALELEALEADLVAEYAAVASGSGSDPPSGLGRRRAVWYAKIIAPVVEQLLGGTQAVRIVNVRNGGAVAWLAADAVVEIPAVIGPGSVRPLAGGGAPADAVALTQHNCAYESLLVDAILEQSFEKAWRAMALNLLVRDAEQARALLERIWPHGGVARGTG
jgi:6-phospho-beta-glucosidase